MGPRAIQEASHNGGQLVARCSLLQLSVATTFFRKPGRGAQATWRPYQYKDQCGQRMAALSIVSWFPSGSCSVAVFEMSELFPTLPPFPTLPASFTWLSSV